MSFDDEQVEVRKDSDGSYLFHVFIGEESPLRLLMLCPADYPITGPELDLYDEFYQKCEPVDSRILEDWSFYQYLSDLFKEYQEASAGGEGGSQWLTQIPSMRILRQTQGERETLYGLRR